MSEQQPQSFMAKLDQWTEASVIKPLLHSRSEDLELIEADIKKAIRVKVLESYRNGQAAPAGRQGGRHGR
jgi:tRNA(Ser,Leu) C12 N-acetylase TAN1